MNKCPFRLLSTFPIKRIMILFLSAALFALMAGCQLKDTRTTTFPGENTTLALSEATTETTAALTSASDTTSASQTTAAAPAAELSEILDVIAKLPNGTAGISLKQASAAARILDWAEGTALSQEGITAQIALYFESLVDPSAVGLFTVNFEIISSIPQRIIDGDANTLGTVDAAGYTLAHASYTQAKWDAFMAAYRANLPNMYSSYADLVSYDPETGWAMFDYWDMLKGDDAVAWLVENQGYTEADAEEYVSNFGDSEFIYKNINPRLRVVDMSDVQITMMHHADGTPVEGAEPVPLTFEEFGQLYAANPDGVLHSFFYYITVEGGTIIHVDQVFWP